ncbi:MAG: glycoside hydrolase family 78 protein, partial [Phaeodactylibacter sp.]|nr:glycoside hydrolase family 78 protein [Phaeodactylibacter sp.]
LHWDSGRVSSSQSLYVPYAGAPLEAGKRYYWQVRVWDEQGNASGWSPPAWWEMGLGGPEGWRAQWIAVPWKEDETAPRPAPMLRRTFELNGAVARARAYITSRGLYLAYLNGEKVGDQVFTPGWTSYNERLQYQVYDITGQLKEGPNAIGVILGDGWYRGRIGWVFQRNHYGSELALLMQVEVEYADGRREVIASDKDWRAATGPILESDIYDGEVYDARKEHKGWAAPGFDAKGWQPVKMAEYPKNNIISTVGVPVRKIQEMQPVRVFTTPKGEQAIDFGQNLTGWVRLRLKGPAGHTVKVEHAEVLDKDGNFYTANLRKAKARLEYTLRGGGEEVYEPHFTFMGFRYAKVENWPGELTPESVTAVAIHSDMAKAGSFECSAPLINQLQHNIQWGQKGNFLDVPTDCPQRDERLGWTGDAQAFSRTAAFNYDVAAFFLKWLGDVAADQREDGAIPFVIPQVLKKTDCASAGWADAATIIPWNLYLAYGDKRFLEQQYESMKGWVGYMAGQAGEGFLWDEGFHFGDWLFYRPDDDNDGRSAVTDKYLIAQCFFAHSTDILRKAAAVLGKKEDEAHYAKLLDNIKAAFLREYMTPNGRLASSTQTAYVLALAFDMLPEDQRRQAAERLAENVRRYGHITTGFLGTPHICHVLSEYGFTDLAYDLLFRRKYPSWLYPVTMGATTIWERWDGIKPDGSFQNVGMNSFNHYAYGAIGDWLYRRVAGIAIDPANPGYKHIVIQPEPTDSLSFARAIHECPYGVIESGWGRDGDRLKIEVSIPPNTRATVRLPGAEMAGVRLDGELLGEKGRGREGESGRVGDGVLGVRQDGEDTVLEVGSGTYVFEY